MSSTRPFGAELDALRAAGTFKHFNTLLSPQGPVVEMAGRGEVIVLSSNNYLGLANDPRVVEAGIEGLRRYGAGTASVRFICGTFEPHAELERALAELSGTEAALTYVSCWNANEALVPTLTDESTVILSDALNHASIVDAIRLARPARKVIYPHSDLETLGSELAACELGPAQARDHRRRLLDGGRPRSAARDRRPSRASTTRRSFSTTRTASASSASTGSERRSTSVCAGEIDVVTGTLGKALGGAAGGYVAASADICELLAQRSRPQLFSNALPATVACSALAAVEPLRDDPSLVARLRANTTGSARCSSTRASLRSPATRRSSRSCSARRPWRSASRSACSSTASS